MSLFEEILTGLVIGGKIVGPVFIHSDHGTAILNASEEALGAILQAHQTAPAAPTAPAVPVAK
jgi:hypothetical protein